MKKTLLILLCFTFILSCNKKSNNFVNNEWGYLIYDKDLDEYEINASFHNDSFGNYPLIYLNDSMVSVDYKKLKNDSSGNNIETIHKYTALYDFKYFYNRPFLLIKENKPNSSINIYHNKKRDVVIYPTSNFFKPIDFKVGDFMIGDTIYKDNLVNIEEKKYDLYDFEANPNNNENIILRILNNIIYSIEQKMIGEDKINNIVKVISKKSGMVPDTIKPSSPFYEEGFRWKGKSIDIRLSKKDMVQYYTDRLIAVNTKENFAYIRLNLYREKISDARITNDYWNLEYNHDLLQKIIYECNLIETHDAVKSTIIE